MTAEEVVLRLAAVVLLGVGAQWAASRLRLPSILLLLGLGLIAGAGTGFIDPDELFGVDLLIPAISLSVAVILFEGGLGLRVAEVRGVGRVVRNLIIVGTVVTLFIATVFAHFVLGLSLSLSLLLGAVLVVTGPTVVIPLLDHIRPIGQTKALLRWEGIIIDPIGAVLALLLFEAVFAEGVEEATVQAIQAVLMTLVSGGGIGLLAAGAMVVLLQRYWIPDELQNPVMLMAVLAATAAANWIQAESGLLAATVMGIALANQRAVSVRHILEFKESLRVLLIGSLFIVLAARLDIDDLKAFDVLDAAFLPTLIIVARPLAVAISTLRSSLSWQERTFLALMAPRSIVAVSLASILALRLADEGFADAGRLVPLTFLVVIGTIAFYGVPGPYIARALSLTRPNPQGVLIVGAHPWARELAAALQANEIATILIDSNRANVHDARLAGLSAHYANVLSEDVQHDLDLDDIVRLLAVTPNDEVNALAAQHFAELFDRQHVYQMAPKVDVVHEDPDDRQTIPRHLRGRILFGTRATHEYVSERVADGAIVKSTTLSEEFDYDDFVAMYGDDALRLFIVTEAGELTVVSADATPTVKAGQTLISLVDPAKAAGERPAAVATAKSEREGR
ncbi:MAG: cation:proton antiporter [Chloroflexi bacterium]|nr:cation:proton antiporter [Chloroflexota bacterium]MCI0855217.1 cation:proton antiporter [Chloroflexota bacterium]MCI0889266.1 cation:proton antiporter [Chloroflexota bacterium]